MYLVSKNHDIHQENLEKIQMDFAPLRGFQRDAILNFLARMDSPLIHAPTGSGKSVIMAYLVKYAAEVLNWKVVIAIHGIHLIDQFAGHLQKFRIGFGVIQGNHKLTDQGKKVQLASIDTAGRRKLYPKADLIIVDECHRAMSAIWLKFFKNYNCPVVGFTATPYIRSGFNRVFSRVIRPVLFDQLVKLGFLVAPRYFALVKIDTKKLNIRNGEYAPEDVELACNTEKVFEEILGDFRKHDEGMPALGFCVSIAHARAMEEYFSANGVPAASIDHSVKLGERKQILDNLVSGKLRIVFNIETLTTGVDLPPVSLLLLCRPTKSKIIYIQTVGRGTRPYPGKSYCKVLDFSGNIAEHGFVEDAPAAWMEPAKVLSAPEIFMTTCPECECVFKMTKDRECPECGREFPEPASTEPESLMPQQETALRELDRDFCIQAVKKIARQCKAAGYKEGAVFHRFAEEYGATLAKRYCPYNRIYELYT